MMAVKLNGAGRSHANSLIEAGKVNQSADWSFSAEDGNSLLGDPPDWAAYGKWFLGVDDAEDRETKAHYKYPFGKDGQVYRSALRAIASRAAQQNETEISDSASGMLDKLDKKDKEEQGRQQKVVGFRKKGQAPTHEAFRAKFTLTDTNLEQGTFAGYASVFGSEVDTWPRTVVDPGAFTKTLTEGAGRVKVLWQHDPWCPIGKPIEMREDNKGLYVVGKISDTQAGRDALTLLRDGVVEEMSIGFDPIRWEMVPDPAAPQALQSTLDGQVRHLKEVRLWEFSLVTFAADPMAQVYAVHSLPTAEIRHQWNEGQAEQRVRRWSGFTDDGRSDRRAEQRYAQAHLAGHLVADVVDGRLQLVPVALLRATTDLLMEKLAAAKMSPDECKQLIEEAKSHLERILAAANGEDEEPGSTDTSADSETQSVARAEALARHKAAIEFKVLELEAAALLVGVR